MNQPYFTYKIDTNGELHPYLNEEWLLTSGHGAFAASSVVGCNTRRYHGLLCAAAKPPLGRIMTLNRVGEIIHLDGKEEFHELSINQFRHSFHPRGDKLLRSFTFDDAARWTYLVEGVEVVKTLTLLQNRNAIAIHYKLTGEAGRKVFLRMLPFVSMRDFHSLRRAEGANFQTDVKDRRMTVKEHIHTLHLTADAGEFKPAGEWWHSHTYAIETDRGMDDHEDLFVPGHLVIDAVLPLEFTIYAALDDDANGIPEPEADIQSRQSKRADIPGITPNLKKLFRAAEDFVVTRKNKSGEESATILAGYPWFADWGRDAMISLPGLLLCTQRHQLAGHTLAQFASHVSEGMIPNRFDDYTHEASYNTVDASLWFINACFEYVKATNDRKLFEEQLLPACKAIVKGYMGGTRFHIYMDADGLISSGDPSTQLTWMDAKCNGVVFTPRHGKAVEINALWHNALMLLGDTELAGKVAKSFVKTFWVNPFRGLLDVVHKDHIDNSIRPNQIFAVSLTHSPLSLDQQSAVVETVRRELLTPYGLRTLSKADKQYLGRYSGGPFNRDKAYHNGTVWAWLIGPFIEAYLKVHQNSPDAQRQARCWLQPLLDHMHKGCIGQIAEIFEGDEPHRPVGCFAQAWSIAEVLRAGVLAGI